MKHHAGMLIGRALRGRRTRSALTLIGVAATALLVLVLLAAHNSLAAGVRAYAGRADVDLWIAPAGTDNLIRSSGLLPADVHAVVGSLPGVVAADPLLRFFVKMSRADTSSEADAERQLTLLAIGYLAPSGLGGPNVIARGRRPGAPGEVAVDRAAAHRLGVGVGDSVLINGRGMQVVGLSRGTNLLATQFVFAGIDDARVASGVPERFSFVAVTLAPHAKHAEVEREIRARYRGTLSVISREAFVAHNLREVTSGLVPLLTLIAGLGVAVSAVLVVLLVQGLVDDRRSEIAVLLALGSSTMMIGSGLVARAGLLVLAGAFLGGLAALGLGSLLDKVFPSVELSFAVSHFFLTGIMFVVAASVAALVPVLRLRRIDPLDAFRA